MYALYLTVATGALCSRVRYTLFKFVYVITLIYYL